MELKLRRISSQTSNCVCWNIEGLTSQTCIRYRASCLYYSWICNTWLSWMNRVSHVNTNIKHKWSTSSIKLALLICSSTNGCEILIKNHNKLKFVKILISYGCPINVTIKCSCYFIIAPLFEIFFFWSWLSIIKLIGWICVTHIWLWSLKMERSLTFLVISNKYLPFKFW